MDNNLTEPLVKSKTEDDRSFKVKASIFLASVTGLSALIAFGATVSSVKKKDPEFFNKGIVGSLEMRETGASLATRALGWGTLYAFIGCGLVGFSIWKLSGAKDMDEFKMIMGSHLPKIKKNDPPQGRTDFEGITDLLNYLFDEKVDK